MARKFLVSRGRTRAQINGIPTNVNVELGASATAGDVVRVVVKG